MRRRSAPLAAVAAAFVVSRLAIAALGVRFDISLMPWQWQLLDVKLLQHDLVRSVWNLHSQPPVYNLTVGLALKLFPGHVAGAFHVAFLLLGLSAALALEVMLERLGFRRTISVGLAILISCAPWWLIYENWLYYEYPVMCLLVLAGLALSEFARAWRLRWGVLFFSLLALIVYTRASFQIVWVLLVVLVLVLVRRDAWRPVLKAAAIPLVVVALLYGKNAAQFGVPSTTSWFGMNLARITLWVAPQPRVQQLVADGTLSKVALVPPFSPLARYRDVGVPLHPPTGVPALDRPMKSNGGVNLNDITYVDLSRRYLKDSFRFTLADPAGYVHGVGKALGKLSVPASDYSYVYPERDRIRLWDRVFNAIVYWRTPWAHGIGFALPLIYIADTVWGLLLLLRHRRSGRKAGALEATALFLWVTTTYLLVVASLTDFGENERVHLPIDPLVLVLAALVARDGLKAVRSRAKGVRVGA